MANTFREVYKKTGSSSYQLVGNVGVGGVKLDVMKGASSSTAGEIGLVPKPSAGKTLSSLRGNGNWEDIFPVGSIYLTVNETNPSTYFGGTWSRINGKFLVGVDENDNTFSTVRNSGGEKEVKLTVNEIPSHGHIWQPRDLSLNITTGSSTIHLFSGAAGSLDQIWTSNTGGGQAHNNLPPYFACYIWERTA